MFGDLRRDELFASKDRNLVDKIYSRLKKACYQDGKVNYGGIF